MSLRVNEGLKGSFFRLEKRKSDKKNAKQKKGKKFLQFKNIPGELESERVQGRKKDLNIEIDKLADRETDRKTDRETNREK